MSFDVVPREQPHLSGENPSMPWMYWYESIYDRGVTTPPNTPLTVSKDVQTDSNGDLVSVTNTGTNNNVMSTSPTFEGTIIADSLTLSGTLDVTGVATFTAQPIMSSLTASLPVFTDGSKGLVSNTKTGTVSVVMSESPTLSGTIGGNLTFSGTIDMSSTLTTNSGRRTKITRITSADSPYTAQYTDHEIFSNTDSGAISVLLLAGVLGQTYRIVNTGTSNNNLTITPNGVQNLLGANSAFTLFDGEALIITWETTDHWY